MTRVWNIVDVGEPPGASEIAREGCVVPRGSFPFEQDEIGAWSRLVGHVYDCALDAEAWPETVASIMEAVGATGAQFVTLAGSDRAALSDIMLLGDRDRAMREFSELIATGRQTRVNWAFRNPGLNLLFDYQHSSESEMKSSLFYQEHARPLGVDYYAGIVCRPRRDHVTGLVLFREKSLGHFSPEQIRFLESLMPHVERALLLSQNMFRVNVLAGIDSALAALQAGALAVDARLEVVAINDKGERAAEDAIGLTLADSSIAGSSQTVIEPVLEQLNLEPGDSLSARQRGGRVVLNRRSGLTPFQLVFTHVTSSYASVKEGLCVIFIVDPDEQVHIPRAVIAEAFGLTQTESSVVAMLASGASIAEIAESRRCKVGTVRTHLKSVMQKTRCHRQAELVALILRHSLV